MDRYEPEAIETKWQRVWEQERSFTTPDPEPGRESRREYYLLEMLPYPSGSLHVGHGTTRRGTCSPTFDAATACRSFGRWDGTRSV